MGQLACSYFLTFSQFYFSYTYHFSFCILSLIFCWNCILFISFICNLQVLISLSASWCLNSLQTQVFPLSCIFIVCVIGCRCCVCVCVWGVLYGASWLAVGATGCSRRTWLLSAAANHCVVFKWTFVISLVCHEFTVLFSGGCLWEDFISSIYNNKTWYFFVETWPLLTLIES